MSGSEPREVLTPGEAAALFSVHPRTVTRWANKRLIPSFRTLGGDRRFHADEIHALVAAGVKPGDGARCDACGQALPFNEVTTRETT